MEGKEHLGEITAKEYKLIALLRNTQLGELWITVQNGQPILVEEVHKSIKL